MRVDRQFVFAAVAEECGRIADFIDELDDTQLATPSLCEGWSVKTVAAHLLSVILDGFWVFQWTTLRRGSLARAIDELAQRRAQSPAAEIADHLRRYADRPISPPLFGPLDPLAAVLVHGGDIRIPLGLAFTPDVQRAALALDFLAGPWRIGFVPLGRLRGICLHDSSIGRSWGKGAEIRGPAAALMMAAAGRTALLNELDGPGLPLLRHRLAA